MRVLENVHCDSVSHLRSYIAVHRSSSILEDVLSYATRARHGIVSHR
jgi:hypothetical protein